MLPATLRQSREWSERDDSNVHRALIGRGSCHWTTLGKRVAARVADRARVELASHRLTAERVAVTTTCHRNWLPAEVSRPRLLVQSQAPCFWTSGQEWLGRGDSNPLPARFRREGASLHHVPMG